MTTPVLFDRSDLKDTNGHLACRCRCGDNHPITAPGSWALVCVLTVEGGDVCEPCAAAYLVAHPAETKAVHNRVRRSER